MENINRLKFLRIIVCVGLLAGIAFSFELWFPLTRAFPRAPLFVESPVLIDRLLTIILIGLLLAATFFQKSKILLPTAIAVLFLLAFFDQTRLQPWVYQYFLLLVALVLTDEHRDETIGLVQITLAALYFWSGLQKLNYSFSHEILPKLFEDVFPETQLPFIFIGILIAVFEFLLGIGLIIRKTRRIAVVLAVAMHISILMLLIAKNYNSIVWIWNLTLILLIISAFWKSENSFEKTIKVSKSQKINFAKAIVAASVLLPVTSFFGFWDAYLSGALYSGNVAVGVVRVNDDLYEKLPPKARASVFQTANGGEKFLPFLEWSLAEMNVPVYPAQRVFEKIAADICQTAADKNRIELIIKERPAILDGSYQLTRKTCEQLKK